MSGISTIIVECTTCRAHVESAIHGGFEYLAEGMQPGGRFLLARCSRCNAPMLIRQPNIGNIAEETFGTRRNAFFRVPTTELTRTRRQIFNTIRRGLLMLQGTRTHGGGHHVPKGA